MDSNLGEMPRWTRNILDYLDVLHLKAGIRPFRCTESCSVTYAGFIWCYWTRCWSYTPRVSTFQFIKHSNSRLHISLSLSLSPYSFVRVTLGALYRYGFGAYFNLLPGSEWSAIMLTYGFPLAIIGMALKVKFICFLSIFLSV